jgi:hypothetical protein
MKTMKSKKEKHKSRSWADIVTVFEIRNGDAQPLDISKARETAANYHSKTGRPFSSSRPAKRILQEVMIKPPDSKPKEIVAEIDRLLKEGFAPREVAEMCQTKRTLVYKRAESLRKLKLLK